MFGVGNEDGVITTVFGASDVDRVSAVVRVKQQFGRRVHRHALWRRSYDNSSAFTSCYIAHSTGSQCPPTDD